MPLREEIENKPMEEIYLELFLNSNKNFAYANKRGSSRGQEPRFP